MTDSGRIEGNSQYPFSNAKGQNPQSSNQQQQPSKTNPAEDADKLKHLNPIVRAQLEKVTGSSPRPNRFKKTPPLPHTRFREHQRGYAINPRKVKPAMPERLKAFFDSQMKNIDRLTKSLDVFQAKDSSKKFTAIDLKEQSLASLLHLNEDILEKDISSLVKTLEEALEYCDEDRSLKSFIGEVLNELAQSQQEFNINPFLKLFIPIYFPYVFRNADSGFDKDLEELYKDDDEKFFGDGSEDNPEEDFEDMIAMEIFTANFGKLLFILKLNKARSKLRLAVKGDSLALELAMFIESSVEDSVNNEIDDVQYLLRLWQDNSLKVSEERSIMIKSEGQIDALLLRVANCILDTVYRSDEDEYYDNQGVENLV